MRPYAAAAPAEGDGTIGVGVLLLLLLLLPGVLLAPVVEIIPAVLPPTFFTAEIDVDDVDMDTPSRASADRRDVRRAALDDDDEAIEAALVFEAAVQTNRADALEAEEPEEAIEAAEADGDGTVEKPAVGAAAAAGGTATTSSADWRFRILPLAFPTAMVVPRPPPPFGTMPRTWRPLLFRFRPAPLLFRFRPAPLPPGVPMLAVPGVPPPLLLPDWRDRMSSFRVGMMLLLLLLLLCALVIASSYVAVPTANAVGYRLEDLSTKSSEESEENHRCSASPKKHRWSVSLPKSIVGGGVTRHGKISHFAHAAQFSEKSKNGKGNLGRLAVGEINEGSISEAPR